MGGWCAPAVTGELRVSSRPLGRDARIIDIGHVDLEAVP
jgi:hypothetical protein